MPYVDHLRSQGRDAADEGTPVGTSAQPMSALAADYASRGYAVIHQLVGPELAAEWESTHRSLPGRMVHVGREFQTKWMEQKLPDPLGALEDLRLTDRIGSLVKVITGLEEIDWLRTRAWINRYRSGEHVPSHCDRAGITQLVLCLQGLAEPEKGGELFIRDEVVPLRTGDAVLFFARGVPHGTMPVGGARVGPSGVSRVTCVFRLFALEDPPGAPA
jgi:hypothetical protein